MLIENTLSFEGKYAVKDITGHVRIIHRLSTNFMPHMIPKMIYSHILLLRVRSVLYRIIVSTCCEWFQPLQMYEQKYF